jgi:hypothetical protein
LAALPSAKGLLRAVESDERSVVKQEKAIADGRWQEGNLLAYEAEQQAKAAAEEGDS